MTVFVARTRRLIERLERRRRERRASRLAREQDARCKTRLIADAGASLAEFLASDARLACPSTGADIDLTVVIVIWNQPHFLLRCLRALLTQSGPAMEIVLVDNGSASETQQLLSRLDGVSILRNPANEGFVTACNQGARIARGRALLMLNSDAFVRHDALANASAALEADAEIGAVGGRLILPSGKLQEAGCVVWSDATTSGYGRGWAPDAGEVMSPRDVDYCSGAFLMTRRALWTELGGFDEAFTPGYYEEVDYCLRLRQAGYRVLFEPSVAVDHFEHGSEVKREDALRTSERNRRTFQERHASTLRSQPVRPANANPPPGTNAR